MELKNCKRCGGIFLSNGFSEECTCCMEYENHDYNRIREYLLVHPGAKVFEIVNNLNISIEKIKHFLKEGRLEIVENIHTFLFCESCGTSIHSGTLCSECNENKKHDFKGIYTGKDSLKKKYALHYRAYSQSNLHKTASK